MAVLFQHIDSTFIIISPHRYTPLLQFTTGATAFICNSSIRFYLALRGCFGGQEKSRYRKPRAILG